MQKTCCQRAEILVTAGDRERIAAHSGRRDAWSLRRPEDASYLEHDPDDPNWLRYTTDAQGRRWMLTRRQNGDCTFLGAQGCVLPLNVRPLVCRLYPFSYTERGLDDIDDGYCPTETLLKDEPAGSTMLTVLDMNRVEAERWRAHLYAELTAERSTPCASA